MIRLEYHVVLKKLILILISHQLNVAALVAAQILIQVIQGHQHLIIQQLLSVEALVDPEDTPTLVIVLHQLVDQEVTAIHLQALALCHMELNTDTIPTVSKEIKI